MKQPDDSFDSTLAGSPTGMNPPEWVDCDSEFIESIENAGLQDLADDQSEPWTWHHGFMSKLSYTGRAALVALCERHLCQTLTWQEAASMLHSALGEPPSPKEMYYGGYDDADYSCGDKVTEYEPQEEDYCDKPDPSDEEPDMGYREDYDEDDTNWEPHDEQDDENDEDGLTFIDNEENDGDEMDEDDEN